MQDTLKLVLESNLLNFSLGLGLITWLAAKAIPDSTSKRKAEIEKELNQAKEACQTAEQKLTDLNKRISQAKQDSETIVKEAHNTAVALKEQIIEEARLQIIAMQNLAESEIESKKNQVLITLKNKVAEAALKLAEDQVKLSVSDPKQKTKFEEDFSKSLSQIGAV